MRPNPINGRSKPPSGTNLQNTQKQAHPTKHKEHPMPQLLPLPQPQIKNSRSNMLLGLILQNTPMNSLVHMMGLLPFQNYIKPITGNRATTYFRSRWVEMHINLVVGIEPTTPLAATVVMSVPAAVAAFKRMSSASHWTWEAWAIDSLRDSIRSVVVKTHEKERVLRWDPIVIPDFYGGMWRFNEIAIAQPADQPTSSLPLPLCMISLLLYLWPFSLTKRKSQFFFNAEGTTVFNPQGSVPVWLRKMLSGIFQTHLHKNKIRNLFSFHLCQKPNKPKYFFTNKKPKKKI